MRCPACQFDNPVDMKFCVDCGAKLETTCPNCKFLNQPHFKFCGQCGCPLPSEHATVLEISEQNEVTVDLEAPVEEATYPDREKLSGRREVDELFIGGQKSGPRGRGAHGKTIVAIAVER